MRHLARFTHDCDTCTFIGLLGQHDIYLCPQGGMPTVIARWGNDGPEYISGPQIDVSGVRLNVELEPNSLRSMALQLHAVTREAVEEAIGRLTDTDIHREMLAHVILQRVSEMYQRGYVNDEPTLEQARVSLKNNLVSRHGDIYPFVFSLPNIS